MLQFKNEDGYNIIKLDNGVPNSLSSSLICEFSAILDRAADQRLPLVITGNPKFFSMGLNLPEVIEFSKDEFRDYIEKFDLLVHKIFTLPVPVVCALEGHAVAGGAILALACDMRIGVDEARKFGCNEARLGVPVPYLPTMLFRNIVSQQIADKLIFQGEIISFRDALGYGLMDSLVPESEIIQAAGECAKDMIQGAVEAFSAMKSMKTDPVTEKFHENNEEYTGRFVQCWYEPSSQDLIRKAAQHF